MKKVFSLFLFILIILTISSINGFITASHIDSWYTHLNHPFFSPPNWLFAPVWTTIYVLIAISAWLIFIEKQLVGIRLYVFLIQMALNFAWTFVFFIGHWIAAAFFEMTILWFFILWNMVLFRQLNKASFYLLVPYILWVSFAWVLNLSYWVMN